MKIVFIVIICFFVICFIVYAYYGGFKKLKVQLAVQGGETVVFDTILGDYRQSGLVMDKIYYSLLNDYKIETFKGYGKYFDNPKKVEKSKLRSEAGCIVEANDVNDTIKAAGVFKLKVLPTQRYLISEFPYKGKLSVIFSIMKVYPLLSKFAESHGFDGDGAIIELYDIPNKKIMYRKEIIEK